MKNDRKLDRMVQIGEGGIWVAPSIAEKHHLERTTRNGGFVEDPPIESFVPSKDEPIIEGNKYAITIEDLETGSLMDVLARNLRNVFRPISPAAAVRQLRKAVAGS